MSSASLLPPSAVLPDKIARRHRKRAAMVYIRQSTVQQIERDQESTRLQDALVDRAFQFGWARESIVVIDDDLGRSGATTEGRFGFQRLVAEVGLGHVGLVMGVEMSRLARSCRDWHQLLEICALFDTLIGDADGIYDPASYNDRLLLGLKGTMSEAELHILKARMLEGRRSKAGGANSASRCRWGIYDARQARWRSIPMSRRRQRSARCSNCSSGSARSARCCAIWSSTTSECRCARPVAPARASLNGAAPTGPHCIICSATRSTPVSTPMA